MMNHSDEIIETFSELSPRYETVIDSEMSRLWGWRLEAFVERILNETPIQPDDKILDIATGTALIPRKLQSDKKVQKKIHGLDITYAMLQQAKKKIIENNLPDQFCLVCASAMSMPYAKGSFNTVLCSLASHHMDVHQVVKEVHRILPEEGLLTIADVGGYPIWKVPGLKYILKIFAFLYFSIQENISRAWAEAEGVSNIRSVEQWDTLLQSEGFVHINITRLRSRFFWIPQPILIKAQKGSRKNGNNN